MRLAAATGNARPWASPIEETTLAGAISSALTPAENRLRESYVSEEDVLEQIVTVQNYIEAYEPLMSINKAAVAGVEAAKEKREALLATLQAVRSLNSKVAQVNATFDKRAFATAAEILKEEKMA